MTLLKFNQKPFEGSFNNFVDDLIAGLPVLTGNEADQAWKGSVPVNIKGTKNKSGMSIVIVHLKDLLHWMKKLMEPLLMQNMLMVF